MLHRLSQCRRLPSLSSGRGKSHPHNLGRCSGRPGTCCRSLAAVARRGLTHHQDRLHDDLRLTWLLSVDQIEEQLKSQPSQFSFRLAHRRQRRILIARPVNIIDPHHRDIIRNAQAGLAPRAHTPQGQDVPGRKQRREALAGSQ